MGEPAPKCRDTRIDARAPAEAQPDAYARDDYVSPATARTAHTDARALVEARPDAYARDDSRGTASAFNALTDARAPAEAQPDAYARDDAIFNCPATTAHTDARALSEAQSDAHARDDSRVTAPVTDGYVFVDATASLQKAIVEEKNPGLLPPMLKSAPDLPVTGAQTKLLRKQNKQIRQERQRLQSFDNVWKRQQGQFSIPTPKQSPKRYVGSMCPSGLALEHPAAATLLEYASGGCPTKTGKNWSRDMIEEAVQRGPHVSATTPEAIEYFKSEIQQKVETGQARIVDWDEIKDNLPPELKLSPLALVPHKSRKFRAILDLSFRLRLESGAVAPSVNETSEKVAPQAACEQLGHVLNRIIHAFAEADEDAKVFMAKFDVKDGFWRLNCAAGEEWNFAYVMPQAPGEPIRLVVPTSLQMGWIESPPFFCTASE